MTSILAISIPEAFMKQSPDASGDIDEIVVVRSGMGHES